MNRESFIFYASFHEACKNFTAEQYGKIMFAINEYSLNGTVPDFSDDAIMNAIFILVKPQIDANNKRYEDGIKGSEYGKLGGRPKKTNEKTKNPMGFSQNENNQQNENPMGFSQKTPNVNVNVNETATVTVNERGFSEKNTKTDTQLVENSNETDSQDRNRQLDIKKQVTELFGDNISDELFSRLDKITRDFSSFKTEKYIKWLYDQSRLKDNPRGWLFKCADSKYTQDAFKADYDKNYISDKCLALLQKQYPYLNE